MLDSSKLRPDTRAVWLRLEREPLLSGFVLIGGTALALRIGHRVSEDLDFAYLGDLLPVSRLRLLADRLRAGGMSFELNQDLAAEQEFENSGLSLEEHQQNFLADGLVKVSFVRFGNAETRLLSGSENSPMRVATLDEIFKLKAIVCAERSKSRDWVDLFILMTRFGYDIKDLHRAFIETGNQHNFTIAEMRLRSCKPNLLDEGYAGLADDLPAAEQMRAYFNDALDQLQVDLAREAFAARMSTAPPPPGE
jgi:hypothetical protein